MLTNDKSLARDEGGDSSGAGRAADDAGSGVQDHMRVSSAQDTSDRIDFYFIRGTNFY